MSVSTEFVHRSCPICEASCGLRMEVDRESQRVVRIEGDENDPRSQGYLCPKAYAVKALHEDPDRLRKPIRKREDGSWEELSWEDALNYVSERLRGIRDEHGANAVGYYIGNPTGHNAGAQLYTAAIVQGLGTERSFSAGTMDQWSQNVALHGMLGDAWMFPVPDLDRTDYFVCMGGNPLASQGSLMSAPNARRRLVAIRERGGKVVVVDPRRTETAKIASEHLFIRPGTDAYFLFAIVHTLFEEGLVALGRLGEFTEGVDRIQALASDFTPEAVAEITGIDAERTRGLAREFAAAKGGAWYGRIGLCTQEFGTLASWLCYAIAVLTGNFDRVGGTMLTRPATGNAEPGPVAEPIAVGPYRTVARGIPSIDGQIPCGLMAEEIEAASAGDERIRAMLMICGNPVLSSPNGERLDAALGELDFMVSVDIYLNETTQHSDVILPSTTHLEHENYDFLFQSTAVRNFARWSPRTFDPGPEAMDHWRILLELAARYNGASAEQVDDLMLNGMLAGMVGGPDSPCPEVSAEAAKAKLGDERGPMRLLDLMVRVGPYGDKFDDQAEGLSLDKLRALPHALDLGALEPRLPEVLKTPGRKLILAPEHVTDDVPRLREAMKRERDPKALLLVGRRQVRNMNSWLHNLPVLAKGRNRCTLLLHSDDAKRLGVADGGKARVRSRTGELVVEATISDDMMPGVVSLPHGFGHTRSGTRLRVATETLPGVNSNTLTDELPLDVPSGNHVANGIPVWVEGA